MTISRANDMPSPNESCRLSLKDGFGGPMGAWLTLSVSASDRTRLPASLSSTGMVASLCVSLWACTTSISEAICYLQPDEPTRGQQISCLSLRLQPYAPEAGLNSSKDG